MTFARNRHILLSEKFLIDTNIGANDTLTIDRIYGTTITMLFFGRGAVLFQIKEFLYIFLFNSLQK